MLDSDVVVLDQLRESADMVQVPVADDHQIEIEWWCATEDIAELVNQFFPVGRMSTIHDHRYWTIIGFEPQHQAIAVRLGSYVQKVDACACHEYRPPAQIPLTALRVCQSKVQEAAIHHRSVNERTARCHRLIGGLAGSPRDLRLQTLRVHRRVRFQYGHCRELEVYVEGESLSDVRGDGCRRIIVGVAEVTGVGEARQPPSGRVPFDPHIPYPVAEQRCQPAAEPVAEE